MQHTGRGGKPAALERCFLRRQTFSPKRKTARTSGGKKDGWARTYCRQQSFKKAAPGKKEDPRTLNASGKDGPTHFSRAWKKKRSKTRGNHIKTRKAWAGEGGAPPTPSLKTKKMGGTVGKRFVWEKEPKEETKLAVGPVWEPEGKP